MQLSEFVSYWSVIDVTFSQYRSLPHADRLSFLGEVLGRYVERRHGAYSSHGYTATALQSKADTFAHKRQGVFGRTKMGLQLEARGIEHGTREGEPYYLWPDGGDASTFRTLLDAREITFTWSEQYKGKLPDLAIVRPAERVVIVEHKHMKEGGGGQDNVVTQVAEFVAQHQDVHAAHYVAYMDGVYVNRLFDDRVTSPKIREQRRQIEQSLSTIPTNYFVNTYGFELLLDELGL